MPPRAERQHRHTAMIAHDQGHSLASALRILRLEDDILGLRDDLAAERAVTASLQRQLDREHGHGRGPPAEGHGKG